MEVHPSLPSQYLVNPYLVKNEQPSSAPSTPLNKEMNHTVAQRRSATDNVEACSPGQRYYEHGGNSAGHSKASTIMHNGRLLTADRKRPYKCDMCASKFGSKMELEEHQNSHTGLKPFECTLCKARFNRRSTLWNHKRIHSDDKPFECSVCRMTFKWKNSLKCHKEMHQRKNEISGFDNDPNEKTLTYATAAKRRLMGNHDLSRSTSCNAESSQTTVSLGSSRKRTQKSSLQHRIVTSAPNNSVINNNNVLVNSDNFIHTPLQADGLFNNQKTLSISDHKELDSLLSNTRLSSMLKEEAMFKANMCEDLTSGINNHNNVFDAKQEMNLFHPNRFMVFGTQLNSSVQSFAPTNLSLPNSNGTCGDYFHIQFNQSDQMLNQAPSSIALQPHSQYSEASSQADLLLGHNAISYQPQVDSQTLLAPSLDYSITPTTIDYMLSGYSTNSIQTEAVNDVRSGHITYNEAHTDSLNIDRNNDGKEVPQVSW